MKRLITQKKTMLICLAVVVISCLFMFCCVSCVNSNEEPKHEPSTNEFIELLNNDSELKLLTEKSLAKAAEINPDKKTNPAQNLDELYEFLDWSSTCLPGNVLKDADYPTMYEHTDQGVSYFGFLVDQELDELKDKGYYYPSLQYYEPIASGIKDYSQNGGSYLSSSESGNDDYYNKICEDDRFQMKSGIYADHNIWTSYNDGFSRKLIDPSVRPISNNSVVLPADSQPQGLGAVDANGQIELGNGVNIKSKRFTNVQDIIGPNSAYSTAFNGGTLTHTFLDVNDYHRYHFPVSGTIKEIRKIPDYDAAGGITIWDPNKKKYVLQDQVPGWQAIETRDCVIIDTNEYGLIAVLPIGMSQVSSCNWESNLAIGQHVEKGDPMGYFLFGGSDIVLLFQNDISVDFLIPSIDDEKYQHKNMGEPYCNLNKKN